MFPTPSDYRIALERLVTKTNCFLDIDEQVAIYTSESDPEVKQFLADEVGAILGESKNSDLIPSNWIHVESSAPIEMFLYYTQGKGLVQDGKFFIDPQYEEWVKGRLFSGGFNLEPSGTKDKLEAQNNQRKELQKIVDQLEADLKAKKANTERALRDQKVSDLKLKISQLQSSITVWQGSTKISKDRKVEIINEAKKEITKLENAISRLLDI